VLTCSSERARPSALEPDIWVWPHPLSEFHIVTPAAALTKTLCFRTPHEIYPSCCHCFTSACNSQSSPAAHCVLSGSVVTWTHHEVSVGCKLPRSKNHACARAGRDVTTGSGGWLRQEAASQTERARTAGASSCTSSVHTRSSASRVSSDVDVVVREYGGSGIRRPWTQHRPCGDDTFVIPEHVAGNALNISLFARAPTGCDSDACGTQMRVQVTLDAWSHLRARSQHSTPAPSGSHSWLGVHVLSAWYFLGQR
jgi:hypothetical protein